MMYISANKYLLVTGGNGFLGRQICAMANKQGIPVVSISRSGRPAEIQEGAYKNVTWVAANIFEAATWAHHLEHCRAVIHCIGILEEQPDKGITYERAILASATVVGTAAKLHGVPKFVYISAGAAAPDTPAGYMKNKLAAENFLTTLDLDLTILKPGMLFGEEMPETITENEAIQQLLNDPFIGPQIRPNRPLPVTTVAKVALYAAINKGFNRKLFVDDIEELSKTIQP